jgi:hypothetical protein
VENQRLKIKKKLATKRHKRFSHGYVRHKLTLMDRDLVTKRNKSSFLAGVGVEGAGELGYNG